jgi:peptide/nickel transport system ATP-binding protein
MILDKNQPAALACRHLSVGYAVGGKILNVVRDVSLIVPQGAALGIVGESGSGKSTLALALANCLPPGGIVTAGDIEIEGVRQDMVRNRRARFHMAKRLSVVFQNPAGALDPSRRIMSLFEQRLRLLGVPSAERAGRATALLESVRIRNIAQVLKSYPHQLSGGMQQRVIIALALANDPAILVLDEPTTGLDATVASEILQLLKILRTERRAGLIFVSHDIGQVHELCDEIAVMYGGELVEQGPADDLLADPRHPYTKSLMACLPSVHERRVLSGIVGAPPSPSQLSELHGCLFAPRCGSVTDLCHHRPAEMTVEDAHRYKCHHPIRGEAAAVTAAVPSLVRTQQLEDRLQVKGLGLSYGHGPSRRRILDDINFELKPGEILAVVGESGSGKSTLLKGLIGLTAPDAGQILLDGQVLPGQFGHRSEKCLSDIRIVFQNPASALNRRRKIGPQIGRCIAAATGRRSSPADWRALSDKVRLPYYNLDNLARSLSGGLLQRVAIACALAGKPRIILFDEPTSALDVSVQADILNLIAEQIRETNASAIFVTHDLAVVRQVADRALVLLHGKVVEYGRVEDIFERPQHEYTERLLAAFAGHGQKAQ